MKRKELTANKEVLVIRITKEETLYSYQRRTTVSSGRCTRLLLYAIGYQSPSGSLIESFSLHSDHIEFIHSVHSDTIVAYPCCCCCCRALTLPMLSRQDQAYQSSQLSLRYEPLTRRSELPLPIAQDLPRIPIRRVPID
jgi:hypothetical protein